MQSEINFVRLLNSGEVDPRHELNELRPTDVLLFLQPEVVEDPLDH